jgi:uncharacterized protein (TIGR00299 family) protein
MVLGALLDAGATTACLDRTVAALGLQDAATVTVDRRQKGNIEATHVDIEVLQPRQFRTVGDIDALIAAAPLDEGIIERSRLAFRLLGQAEARAHGVEVDTVRLHEAGAIDALIDVVGSFALAHELGAEAYYASSLPLCRGTTTSEHGTIPLPAPATVNILEAVGAPTYYKDGDAELVTPTGAAIVGACAVFESPRLDAEHEGFGAGTADLPWPNVMRVVIGEVAPDGAAAFDATPAPAEAGLEEEMVSVIETNIDDMPANLLAAVPQAMLDAGALDAFLTPVLMKKGRPAYVVTVVCAPGVAEALGARLLTETSTLGVRIREERRLVARRRVERMKSALGEVDVKLKLIDGRVVDAVPEYEQVRVAAEGAGMPLQEAHRLVTDEARRRYLG